MLKGGARKTTTIAMLAFALAKIGEEVAVIDADTYTQGLTEWVSSIYAGGGEPPFHMHQWSRAAGGLLVPFVQRVQADTGAGYVLLDMGAEDPDAVRQVLPLLDLVVSPVGPEQAELSRVPATRALVAPLHPHLLLTRVDQVGIGMAAAMRDDFSRAGYRVLDIEVPRNRQQYAHVFGTVPEHLGAYEQVAAELCAADFAEAALAVVG